MGDYKYIVSCIEDRDWIHTVALMGGEPLCHPYFEHLAWEVVTDFPNAVVKVATNGLLLPRLAASPIFPQLHFTISEYPGANDRVVRDFADHVNVAIWPYRGFWDPYRDPDLSDDVAKAVRAACEHVQVRIVGTRLYNCCVAEGIERYHDTEKIHVEFDKSWWLVWSGLPTWRACKHCFRAIDWVLPKMRHETISINNYAGV